VHAFKQDMMDKSPEYIPYYVKDDKSDQWPFFSNNKIEIRAHKTSKYTGIVRVIKLVVFFGVSRHTPNEEGCVSRDEDFDEKWRH